MNFGRLLSKEKVEKVEKSDFDLSSVEKDVEFARKGIETENYGRVMAVAYEAALRAGNRLMNFLGYRAIGKEHHKNLFEFLRESGFDINLVNYFDKVRVKRNAFIYRDVDNISRKEAEETVEEAEMFVQKIRTFVQKIRTGEGK